MFYPSKFFNKNYKSLKILKFEKFINIIYCTYKVFCLDVHLLCQFLEIEGRDREDGLKGRSA